MKKAMGLLVLVLLLGTAGCGMAQNQPPAETSSELSASDSASSASSEPEQAPPEPFYGQGDFPQTALEAVERFITAMKAGDTDEMELLAKRYESPQGRCEYWKAVKLSDITDTALQSEGINGIFELTMNVQDTGTTLLKTGSHRYIMRVGSSGYDPVPMILSITPAEKYIADELLYADKAAEQVMQARNFGFMSKPFSSPDELTDDLDVEYLVALGSSENPDGMTQAQLDQAARKYYGAESFVRTDSRFFDQQQQRYFMWGRGGNHTNDRVVRIDETEENKVLYIELYSDPLQLVLEDTLEYTLAKNDDGTYRYVTIKSVAPIA
ncbi:hypothetical protein [Hydrogenoanaerobacterium sp.]|uniref:hypothetical protein n=1 Tax=Hydrogenoanaerobacterium sp. TaxID=2953763 RepID=UPI00289A472E|nr:hypothetical protein [Hydrogenoanaerobacterium sp.]